MIEIYSNTNLMKHIMPFKSSRSFTSVLSSSNSCKFQEKVRNVEFIESEMNMEENTSNTISLSVLNKNDDYFNFLPYSKLFLGFSEVPLEWSLLCLWTALDDFCLCGA